MATQLPDIDGFSLQVTVYFKPENVPKFFEEFQKVFKKTSAEPECLYFEVYQDSEDPGRISWVENWSKSPQWFMQEQLTKEYYKPYLEATEPLFVKPREFKILKRVGRPYVVSKPENFT